MLVQVAVARLGLDSTTNSYVVILREVGGHRLLPIWIGQPEAESIVMEMNQVKRERPLTHDLCKTIMTALGGVLRRVTVTRVQKSTYFAEMQVEGPAGMASIDARPSDSIALALRFDAPIFAPEELLTTVEVEGEEEHLTPPSSTSADELTPEQLKTYLEHLRPEDFGKFSP